LDVSTRRVCLSTAAASPSIYPLSLHDALPISVRGLVDSAARAVTTPLLIPETPEVPVHRPKMSEMIAVRRTRSMVRTTVTTRTRSEERRVGKECRDGSDEETSTRHT